jgi:cytochrome c
MTAMAAIPLLALHAIPARAADPAAGEMVFEQKCFSCHAVGDGALNKFGPQLNGLFGRAAGGLPGYGYSKALDESGIVWDEAIFAAFIRDPRKALPGTTMPFNGLKDDQEIADLIAYLRGFAADGQGAWARSTASMRED